ncbi:MULTISPECIES: hypothetical protein [Streptosporangium]|uniref:Uncharacterized protein n=1 Tax=Streptosporangium brasiliense TaxID=47480 RepID=A0ABT9RMD6_9ACTN|nr:hypothetical protein [Streptosporangium brasiliense]MDP9870461.1 hypothetical protein [Streptosporangium brasiliense]
MPASYPEGIRTYSTKLGWRNIVWAEHMNTMQEEIGATQTTVGVNPHIARNNPGGLLREYGTVEQRMTEHARGSDLPFYRGMALGVPLVANAWNPVALVAKSDPFVMSDDAGVLTLNETGLWMIEARAEYKATGYSLQKKARRKLRVLFNGIDVGMGDFTGEDARNSFALHNHITWPEVWEKGTKVTVQVRTDLEAPEHTLLANVVLRAYLVRYVKQVQQDGRLLHITGAA